MLLCYATSSLGYKISNAYCLSSAILQQDHMVKRGLDIQRLLLHCMLFWRGQVDVIIDEIVWCVRRFPHIVQPILINPISLRCSLILCGEVRYDQLCVGL